MSQFVDTLIGENVEVATEYFKALMAEKNSGNKNSGGSIGFIPFNVSFTMDGLSGIKIYNELTLDTSFLPPGYARTLDFIVTGVDHKLKDGDWETDIKATLIPKTDDIDGVITGSAAIIQQIENYEVPTEVVINNNSGGGGGKPVVANTGAALEPGFLEAVKALEDKMGVQRNAILRIMKHETGGTFSTSIKNSIGCVGLIQFCPDQGKNYKTINGKKYFPSDLAAMTGLQQLAVVEEFYKPIFGKAKVVGDLYIFTFLPAAVGKPDDFVLAQKGSKETIGGLSKGAIYTSNTGFDTTKKGYYTVGDVKAYIEAYY